MIDKDNILHSISAQKKNLEEKIDKYKTESENMNSTIKELNYKIIEFN
jgi:peptidoglycan hydrolase CwlO-like protein